MELYIEYRIGYKQITTRTKKRKVAKLHILIIGETHPTGYCAGHEEFHHFLKVCFLGNNNLINNLKMKEKIKGIVDNNLSVLLLTNQLVTIKI